MKKVVLLPNGQHLAYIDMGDPKGPPVVLIHGYTDNARDWVPLIPYLNKHFRLIVVDIRGHGQSDKPECCYARIDFAYDIKLLLDSLHIPEGGRRRAFARQHDHPGVGGAVAGAGAQGGPDFIDRRAQAGHAAQEACVRFRCRDSQAEGADRSGLAVHGRVVGFAQAGECGLHSPSAARCGQHSAGSVAGRVGAGCQYGGYCRATLPKLKAPTLLIWGSKDPIMEEDVRQSLRDALPAAKVKVFEGLGHNPFWEEPEAVAKVINGFLDAP